MRTLSGATMDAQGLPPQKIPRTEPSKTTLAEGSAPEAATVTISPAAADPSTAAPEQSSANAGRVPSILYYLRTWADGREYWCLFPHAVLRDLNEPWANWLKHLETHSPEEKEVGDDDVLGDLWLHMIVGDHIQIDPDDDEVIRMAAALGIPADALAEWLDKQNGILCPYANREYSVEFGKIPDSVFLTHLFSIETD